MKLTLRLEQFQSTEPLRDVLQYLSNTIEKTDQMDSSISEFFNTDISNLEVKHRDYSGREYIMWSYSLMKILEQEYRTVKVENHNGNAETPPIWNEEVFNGEKIQDSLQVIPVLGIP